MKWRKMLQINSLAKWTMPRSMSVSAGGIDLTVLLNKILDNMARAKWRVAHQSDRSELRGENVLCDVTKEHNGGCLQSTDPR